MEKDKFLFLLANSNSLTADETSELAALQNEFPYSQAIRNLVARGAQLNELPSKQTKLNAAAVYSTDRVVLKGIITALRTERKATNPKPFPEVAPKKSEEKLTKEPVIIVEIAPPATTTTPKFEPSKLSGDDLLEELLRDLNHLKKLKHDFEIATEAFEKIPAAKEIKTEVPTENKPAKNPAKRTEGIIAEIKNTKKKIKPSDPKQKEQLEIIDKFIKSKPSIGKNKPLTSTDSTDLTENSSVFSDNIVSETLVEILIKQGKKEKAIEVLRKLIWKFPQKKAYFAAQIEELTS